MDLRDYARILRKRWPLVLVCALLSLAAAGAATALATRVYESQTQLFVSARDQGDVTGAYQGGLFTQQRVKSYADIVDSPAVTDAVAGVVGGGLTGKDVAEKITAEVPLDTVLIDITVSDPSPERARDIAAAVAAEFARLVPEVETTDGTTKAPVKVTVVKPAQLPEAPASPRVPVNLALGLLVGLALGVGAAVLRETLDTSVKGGDDLQDIVGTTPLGVIAFDPDAAKRPLIVHSDPHAPRAEAFRQLRTNLQFADVDSPPRTVVVTSAVAEEGKSTTCCNLAVSIAETGARVVLIEADLRRPRVADYLGLEGAVGLTTVLTGGCDVDDALQPWGRELLYVLPSGPLPPNPSEILGSSHMRELLADLARQADFVLIDAPPLLPVTDAAVLARACDGAVLVVRHGRTRREQVRRAAESLGAVGARLLGTVLNQAPHKGPEADSYGYGYGYGRYESRSDRARLDAGAALPVPRDGSRRGAHAAAPSAPSSVPSASSTEPAGEPSTTG